MESALCSDVFFLVYTPTYRYLEGLPCIHIYIYIIHIYDSASHSFLCQRLHINVLDRCDAISSKTVCTSAAPEKVKGLCQKKVVAQTCPKLPCKKVPAGRRPLLQKTAKFCCNQAEFFIGKSNGQQLCQLWGVWLCNLGHPSPI